MTGRGLALLAGAVLATGAGRLLGVPELFVVAGSALALVALAVVTVRLTSAAVAVDRRLAPDRVHAGHGADVVLGLGTSSRLPASVLRVEDGCHPSLGRPTRLLVAGLRRGKRVAVRYRVTGSVRGRYPVGPATVRVRDPFGLAERVRRDRAVTKLLVYPRVEPLSGGAGDGARGRGTGRTRRLFTAGDEFHTMREYVQGDDLRQVHWPSTAHRQTLMVRQQEQAHQQRATVLLDTRAAAHVGAGAESTFERAVSAATSVLAELTRAGYAARLATAVTRTAPAVEAWPALLERLAEVHPGREVDLVPALAALRSTDAEGVLVAVLGPPPGTVAPGAAAGDGRVLGQVGRGYGRRVALVCVDPARPVTASRGEDLVRVLRADRWRAATLATDEPLAPVWAALAGARRPPPPAAVASALGRPGAS